MAKDKAASSGSFFQELLHVGLYKGKQGKVARQVTFIAAAVVVILGATTLRNQLAVWLPDDYSYLQYVIPGVILLGGLWIAYRVVNYPQFADFLIAVEAEMAKVSWPTRTELFRSSMVVIIVIFVLAAVLFCYDIFWQFVFKDIFRVLQ
jgi:preprotein translocase subunit SecE